MSAWLTFFAFVGVATCYAALCAGLGWVAAWFSTRELRREARALLFLSGPGR